MSKKLVNSHDLQYPHQPQYLSHSPDNLIVLKTFQYEGYVEGQQYQQVYQVHRLFEKLPLVRRAEKATEVFQGKEGEGEDVDQVADKGEF